MQVYTAQIVINYTNIIVIIIQDIWQFFLINRLSTI